MHQLSYILQQALMLVLVVSGPPVILSLVVGMLVSVFQAATQIQEQNLTFVPKMIVIFGVLALTGSWMGYQLRQLTFHIFDRFPVIIGG